MGIRVHWKCAVLFWIFMITDSGLCLPEMAFYSVKKMFWGGGLEGAGEGFLGGEEEFGNHVPVDAAQAFIAEKCAGTTGKGLMVKELFENIQGLTRFAA